jgi:hypothetical protein
MHRSKRTYSITSSAVARIKDGGVRFSENDVDFDILPELTDQI